MTGVKVISFGEDMSEEEKKEAVETMENDGGLDEETLLALEAFIQMFSKE